MGGCVISEKWTLSGKIQTALGSAGNLGTTTVTYPTGVVITYGTFFAPYSGDTEEPDTQGLYVNPGYPPSDMVNMLKLPYAQQGEAKNSQIQSVYYKSKKQLKKFLGIDFRERTSFVASATPSIKPMYYGTKKFMEEYGIDTGYGLFGRGYKIAPIGEFNNGIVQGVYYDIGTNKVYKTLKYSIQSSSTRGGEIITQGSDSADIHFKEFKTEKNGKGSIQWLGQHNVQSFIEEYINITVPFSPAKAGLLGTTRSASPRISQVAEQQVILEKSTIVYSYITAKTKGSAHFINISAVEKKRQSTFIIVDVSGFTKSISELYLPYMGYPTSIPVIGALITRRNCCNFGAKNVKEVNSREGFPAGSRFVKFSDDARKYRIAQMLTFPYKIKKLLARIERRDYFPIDDEYGSVNVSGIVSVKKLNKYGEYDEDISTFHSSSGRSEAIPLYHLKKMIYVSIKKPGTVYKELSMNIGNIYFQTYSGLYLLLERLASLSTAVRKRVSGDIMNFRLPTGNAISVSFDYINGTFSGVYIEFNELPINPFG